MSEKPKLFIGSSSEGLRYAQAVQSNLSRYAEARIWDQGVFGLSKTTIETLVAIPQQYDFAVFVVTADDMRESRGKVSATPRDNVIFELGLFMGVLGRERCYVVYDRGEDIQLPTDLLGITCAPFSMHSDRQLQPSIAEATNQISTAISDIGPRIRPEVTKFPVFRDMLFPILSQIAIFMRESGKKFPILLRIPAEASIGTQSFATKSFDFSEELKRVGECEIFEVDNKTLEVGLSPLGKKFADWLLKQNQKAEYFALGNLVWGKRPPMLTAVADGNIDTPEGRDKIEREFAKAVQSHLDAAQSERLGTGNAKTPEGVQKIIEHYSSKGKAGMGAQ
jgi:hypothetical protein